MTPGQIAGCVIFAVLLAAGQVLFKSAALSSPPIRNVFDLGATLQTPVLWLAVLLYGGATVLWVCLLKTVPLSRAYPFAALGFVIVPVAGFWLFGERISLGYVVGAALIVSGVLIIAKA